MFSRTLREILQRRFNVLLGNYSYGAILPKCRVPRGTRIGNYCSIASGVVMLRRNHPTDHISQHPLFFNAKVGLLDEDVVFDVTQNPLEIGNDVWIGQNAIIAPNCRRICDGAVIAAGAVVTADVPAYTIVAGIPARVLRVRFPEPIQRALIASKWWTRPIEELSGVLPRFLEPLDEARAAAFSEELSNFVSVGQRS